MRYTGVTARGIVCPIFKAGDDLANEIYNTLITASAEEGFSIDDNDIICITESVVARCYNNYASCEQIAADIRRKFGGKDLGIVFPILSRNRFSILLKAIAMACDKLYVQLSYPSDEVGNKLISEDAVLEKNVNPYSDSFASEAEFRATFGHDTKHRFTGVDYIQLYKSFGDHIETVISNDPTYILNFTKNVLNCDIHTRKRTKRLLANAGAQTVYGLEDILTAPVDGSGFNAEYGLLGSNMATEDKVKLFPSKADSMEVITSLKQLFQEKLGKSVEVMIYGDGCFKDPVGGIWELADPVVSPAFTSGLSGTPNEIKIKYFADNELSNLTGAELGDAIQAKIRNKDSDLVGEMASQGTTPRQYTDLIGSLSDLVSGSGDRGTPVVLIKGYFTNYASE
ncbi:coenzyme F420-0:L-glutamate ligase [Ruminococcaceae bacterium OttesenSCG-928-L11]|nr:coenzyme F420-0:L-glutamate ligase [Ruminococcaceae bacterium OttesenSCG-928-L11]